jgi:hypothetical protein
MNDAWLQQVIETIGMPIYFTFKVRKHDYAS